MEQEGITLNVWERMNLANILPEKGNFIEACAVSGIKKNLILNEEESNKIGFKQVGERFTWDQSKDFTAIFIFTETEKALFSKVFSELDKENGVQCTDAFINLYKKFL